MLTLPRSLSLTPDQFAQVCAANPEAVLELAADGTLIEMTPTGGNTSARNSALVFQLQSWARTGDGWIVGAPCVMPPGWRRLRSFQAW